MVELRQDCKLEAMTQSDHGQGWRGTFSFVRDRAKFFRPGAKEELRILVIADTHLALDDERGLPCKEFSSRMASAFYKTRHVRTGLPTSPPHCFEEALAAAIEAEVDLVILNGDILSFPSEAGVEWVCERLESSGLRWVYTCGNHDWHYEGLPGSMERLRIEWSALRLSRLHQGREPLMASLDIKGLKIVVLDNSTYEIKEEQLEFFLREAASGDPLLLAMHIPLYAPGRGVMFGCGHPEWGAKTDQGFETERRPRWPEAGHTAVTMEFHREVFSTPNLLGVLSGHIHEASVDVVNGIPQIVSGANAGGGVLWVDVGPLI